MQHSFRFLVLALGLLSFALLTPMTSGQGKKKGMMDPEARWERASGGKSSFAVKDYTSQWKQEETRKEMLDYLKSKGKTDGMMTKELFLDFVVAQQAQQFFSWTDADKDGKITKEEAKASAERSGRWELVEAWDKYDTAKKGYIELAQYSAYLKDRQAQGKEKGKGKERERDGEKASSSTTSSSATKPKSSDPDPLDSRPVVYRFGKLPSGLPGWFSELDTDKDGQVALYEWRTGGKTVADFRKLDLDGDGLITAEEILRGKRQEEHALALAKAVASGAPLPSAPGGTSSSTGSTSDKKGGGQEEPRKKKKKKGW